jgi:hypothetical protein
MKTLAALMTASAILLLTSGCVGTGTPINGSLFVSGLKSPVAIGDNTAGHSKVGEATASGVIGIVIDGDCSIATAMEKGGITKIHHVDSQVTNILGIYATYTTRVYGD